MRMKDCIMEVCQKCNEMYCVIRMKSFERPRMSLKKGKKDKEYMPAYFFLLSWLPLFGL